MKATRVGVCKNPYCIVKLIGLNDEIKKDLAFGWVHAACAGVRRTPKKVPPKERQTFFMF